MKFRDLGRAAKSSVLFGIYVIVTGLIIMIVPGKFFSLIGIQDSAEVWVYPLGLSMTNLGFYYIYLGFKETISFFRVTTIGRPFAFVMLSVFVFTGILQPICIGFALLEIIGAVWTHWSLGKDLQQIKD